MFSTIKRTSAQRITEVREYLDYFYPLIPAPPTITPRYFNTFKGLVFVQLYGVIEHTVSITLVKVIEIINNDQVNIQDLKPLILSMALSAEFDSLIQVNTKKWDKRIELFKKYINNNHTNIPSNTMPTNGGNFTSAQLESIWNAFSITDNIFGDDSFKWRLQEIVRHRIDIAHGNDSAANIGSRFTPADLYARISDVSNYCSYFISVFEDYATHKKYKK